MPIISPISAKTTVLYPWDPTDKSTVYANGDAGHVLRSIDNGKTWTVLVDYQGLD